MSRMSQTATFSSVQACAARPNGCTRTCRTRFTDSFRGFHSRSPRHTTVLLTSCAQERENCRMHAGAHTRRDGEPTCTHLCMRARSDGIAQCLRNLHPVLLEPSRVESRGEHEDEGLSYVRRRTLRTIHMRAGAPTGEEAGAAIGCSMASTVLPYCVSSLLPHPALQRTRAPCLCARRRACGAPAPARPCGSLV